MKMAVLLGVEAVFYKSRSGKSFCGVLDHMSVAIATHCPCGTHPPQSVSSSVRRRKWKGSLFTLDDLWENSVQCGLDTSHRIVGPVAAERRRHHVGPVLGDLVLDIGVHWFLEAMVGTLERSGNTDNILRDVQPHRS